MAITVILRYEGTQKDKFDREYYSSFHMPLVAEKWKSYGLLSAKAFFPAKVSDTPHTVCICECIFKDKAAFQSALAAECTVLLMNDIKNFTSLEMVPGILSPLAG